VKKFVMGCGCALVLVGIGLAIAGYYFVVRPAQTFMASMTELSAVADLDTALTNTAPYTPPTDGTLSAAQVQRFMAVQEAVKTRLGTRFSELQTKYEQLERERADGEATVQLNEAVGAYRDLFSLITAARQAQVDALNAQQFSAEEYRWVRARVFEAAGVEVTGVDLGELVENVQQGDFTLPSEGARTETSTRAVPPGNKALVAPHLPAIKAWVPYAVFGL